VTDDHPAHTVDPTVQADAIDLLEQLRAARAETERVRDLRARGECGYSDLSGAQFRHAVALLRCRDAGLVVDRFSVDTAALLHRPDVGDGTHRLGGGE
jgi:hypothetical protein